VWYVVKNKMNKTLFVASFLCVFFTLELYGNEVETYSFWIKVVDQEGKPITEAIVFYCLFDCVLNSNAQNRKRTRTDKNGLAQLKLKGNDKLRVQGVEKDGYDIRLKILPYNEVRLQGVDKKPRTSKYFKVHHGIHIQYDHGITPYSQPVTNPLFTVRGWKLGQSACLEQGQQFIFHGSPSKSNWDIDDQIHYYKVGDNKNVIRKAGVDDYDIKIKLSRSGYPWGNLIYQFISSYKLVLEFKQGGAQVVSAGSYLHEAPDKGYKKRLKFNYRGLGEISRIHNKRLFIRGDERYGVLNLEITPSQRIFFEYLLNRNPNQRELNIPSYMGDYGVAADYFSSPSSATARKPKITPPAECARLGVSRFGG
jgi:hypothetical protein